MPGGRLRIRLLVSLLVLASAALTAAAADVFASGSQGRLDEYRLKAALLVSVTQFVQWPHAGALAFCITGDELFSLAMRETIAAKATSGPDMSVRDLDPKEDFTRCDVVFIGHHVARDTTAILKQIEVNPVLTIGESDAFLADGGIVRVFVAGRKIRFQISGGAAEKHGLKISSQLLSLAAR